MLLTTEDYRMIAFAVYADAEEFTITARDSDMLDKITPDVAQERIDERLPELLALYGYADADAACVTRLKETFMKAALGIQTVYMRFIKEYGF